MKTRHQPPSLVSMWMLDVFCCALGCVTLLWLLSTRQANDEAVRNRAAVELLTKTMSDLEATRTAAADAERRLTADIAELNAKLAAVVIDRDATKSQLTAADAQLNQTRTQLSQATADAEAASAQNARQAAAVADLNAKLSALTMSADELAKQVRAKEAERTAAAGQLAQATQKLAALDANAQASAAATAKDAARAGDTLRRTKDDLAAARATIIDLQGQKAKLADTFDKLKADADARFAGIALTGRRVAFVVDISGSMKLIDDKTPAPDKWATVIETVAKVMRSLTELDKFQVVTFSRNADTLFPAGDWQPYEGESSVRRVTDALQRVNPDGDTNMYDALDTAFRMKPSGLDTIYLFSDGLPTSGPGLTADEERTAAMTVRTDKLAKNVLRTLKATWNRPGPGRVRVNAIGFFYESPDVGAFLWALARDNEGSFVGMSRP